MRCFPGFGQRPYRTGIVSSAALIFRVFSQGLLKTGGRLFERFKLRGRIFSTFDLGLLHLKFAEQLTCTDQKAALKPAGGKIRLRVLVDRASVDIFGNDGLLYMPVGVIVPQENRSVEVYAKGGTAQINSLEVHELKSAWE